MNKVLEYIIRAKDATGNAVSSALSKVKSLASGIFKNATNILSSFTMIGNAAKSLMAKMQKSFAFETMTIQFKRLVGGMDEARAHMAMLQKMGDTPPFSLEEFAAASRSLMVMTDGALGFQKSLELVGDAAAATGQPLEHLAHEVGRAYAIIRDGQPITRAVMGLRNMGAITPEVAAKLEKLQKAGASNAEVWAELEKALGKFKGAMEDTERTGAGLMGALSSQWDNAVRSFGGALMDAAKDGIGLLLAKIKEINEDGTLVVWAEKVAEAIRDAMNAMQAFRDKLHEVQGETRKDLFDRSGAGEGWQENAAQFLGNAWAGLGATGAWMRGLVMPGEHAMENYHAYAALHGYGSWADANARELSRWQNRNGGWQGDIDIREAEERRVEEIKAEAAKKRQEAEAAAVESRQAEEARVAEQMAKDTAREAAEEEERERKRVECLIHDLRTKYMKEEVAEYAKGKASAERLLADAQAASSRAWGWYRDRDSWKAQLKEERADAKARQKFEKDLESLDRRTNGNWRDMEKLSDGDELIRRVALAREAEDEARRFAERTAEATQRSADALEEIVDVLGDEEGGE